MRYRLDECQEEALRLPIFVDLAEHSTLTDEMFD